MEVAAQEPVIGDGHDSEEGDVKSVHVDWEDRFVHRRPFGHDFTPPTEVHPARSVPSMTEAPRHSPLDADAFARLLADHPNRKLVEWLVTSIKQGFRNYADMPETEEAVYSPLRSALEWEEVVTKWLAAEVAAGRMLVSDEKPHEFAVASPVGEAPKFTPLGAELKHRVIHHLSKTGFAEDGSILESVNDSIDPDQFSCEYMRVQELVAALVLLAQHGDTEWSSCDIVHGFRNLQLHPDCYHEHTLVWKERWYVDVAVGFGSRCAPFSFSALSAAASWIIQRKLTDTFGEVEVATANGQRVTIPRASVFFLMDDFACVSNKDIAKEVEQVMVSTLAELGMPTQPAKDKHHSTDGKYLGWWIDSAGVGHVTSPDDKSVPIIRTLGEFGARTRHVAKGGLAKYAKLTVTVKELQSLVGKLTFYHPAARNWRPFCNEMLRMIRTQPHGKPQWPMKVTERLREDCSRWMTLYQRNVKSKTQISFAKFTDPHQGLPAQPWACGDASGAGGFGWFTTEELFYGAWGSELAAHLETKTEGDDQSKTVSSTLQETACYAAAILTWVASGPPPHTTFTYLTDAKNVWHNWARGRSGIDRINSILRVVADALILSRCYARIMWQSRKTADASSADMLSRANEQVSFLTKFRGSNPDHPGLRSAIPSSVETRILASTRV